MVTEDTSWVPPEIDTTKANIARVYDWFLGGEHNFRVDQDAGSLAPLDLGGEAAEPVLELGRGQVIGRVVPADLEVPGIGVVDHRTKAILVDMRNGVVSHLFLFLVA